MAAKIDRDLGRFKKIIRGRVRKELRKFISNSELIGRKGKDLISIPIPQIDIPHFVYSDKQKGGIGHGDGEAGDPTQGDGEGASKAGNAPGDHLMEVDLTFEELAEILGEELELPKIEPKGNKEIEDKKYKYSGISPVGPQSLRHFRRTFKRALRRHIISGQYDPENPVIIPTRADQRYKYRKEIEEPQAKAVIIYMMDVSGSMGGEQKETVRLEAFWINTWLKSQYKDLETRYVIHDAVAREVDEDTFFKTRESGGTIISSAYKLCAKIIEEDYDSSNWNIYPFHFSDGDNWSGSDTDECMKILESQLFPVSNVFCYGQVESEYGSGQFLRDLLDKFPSHEQLITSKIENKDAIPKSIKDFLGKGK
ncbi:DUF444 family protein [bacterium]|nr:DUF444 family protein [bacterium]